MRGYGLVAVPIKNISSTVHDIGNFLTWNELLKVPLCAVFVTHDQHYRNEIAIYYTINDSQIDALCDYPTLTSHVRISTQENIKGEIIAHIPKSNDHRTNTYDTLKVIEHQFGEKSDVPRPVDQNLKTLVVAVAKVIRCNLSNLSTQEGFVTTQPSIVYENTINVLLGWRLFGNADEFGRWILLIRDEDSTIESFRRESLRSSLKGSWAQLSFAKKHKDATPPCCVKTCPPTPLTPPKHQLYDAAKNPFSWSDQGVNVSIW